MKLFILALLLPTSLFAQTATTTFFGPTMTCTLENKNHVPSKIELSLFESEIFGKSETIQLLYTYPELNAGAKVKMSLISKFSLKGDLYLGQITNASYLINAELNIDKETLTIIDKKKTYVFSGKCKEAGK